MVAVTPGSIWDKNEKKTGEVQQFRLDADTRWNDDAVLVRADSAHPQESPLNGMTLMIRSSSVTVFFFDPDMKTQFYAINFA